MSNYQTIRFMGSKKQKCKNSGNSHRQAKDSEKAMISL
jgi:hypothetical protein